MFFIARNLLKPEKNSRFIFGRGKGGGAAHEDIYWQRKIIYSACTGPQWRHSTAGSRQGFPPCPTEGGYAEVLMIGIIVGETRRGGKPGNSSSR